MIMEISYYRCDYDILSMPCKSFTTTAHAHEGVEIIYLKNGFSRTFINGIEYEVHPGEVLIIFPNTVHYHRDSESAEALLNLFHLQTLPEFHNVFSTKSPRSPLLQKVDPQAINFLEDLVEHRNKYKPEAKRGILMAAVSMILDGISFSDKSEMINTTLGEILEFCDTHYTEDIHLDTVAKKLMISKSSVSHAFTDKLHISFRDYINSLRIRHALKLLKENALTITEIAYESGFPSVRTFNRAFKKEFKSSPLQYKKQMSG